MKDVKVSCDSRGHHASLYMLAICPTFANEIREKGESFMPYQSANPAAGEVLQVFKEHTDQQMMDALAAADNTYRLIWPTAPYKERAKCIGKAAALMLEQKETLARLATIELNEKIKAAEG